MRGSDHREQFRFLDVDYNNRQPLDTHLLQFIGMTARGVHNRCLDIWIQRCLYHTTFAGVVAQCVTGKPGRRSDGVGIGQDYLFTARRCNLTFSRKPQIQQPRKNILPALESILQMPFGIESCGTLRNSRQHRRLAQRKFRGRLVEVAQRGGLRADSVAAIRSHVQV